MRKENKLYKLDGIPPAARFYLAFSTEAWLKNLKLEEEKKLSFLPKSILAISGYNKIYCGS